MVESNPGRHQHDPNTEEKTDLQCSVSREAPGSGDLGSNLARLTRDQKGGVRKLLG